MATLGVTAWESLKNKPNNVLSEFQPYFRLGNDKIFYSKIPVKKSNQGFDSYLENFGIYGGIESVSIIYDDLKIGTFKATVDLKVFRQTDLSNSFFNSLLTIGSIWSLEYGWYIASQQEVYRTTVQLCVTNYSLSFSNDGTLDIQVQFASRTSFPLMATGVDVVGGEIVKKLTELQKTTSDTILVSKFVQILNDVFSAGNKPVKISYSDTEEIKKGTTFQFLVPNTSVSFNNQVQYVKDIPLYLDGIIKLITSEPNVSCLKLLNDTIVNQDYYCKIYSAWEGIKKAKNNPKFHLFVEDMNGTIYIYNRLYHRPSSYVMNYGTPDSLIQSVSFQTKFSITQLIEYQKNYLRREGNAFVNKDYIDSGEASTYSNSLPNLIRSLQPRLDSPGPILTGDSVQLELPGSQSFSNQTVQPNIRFVDFLDTYFYYSTVEVFGIPGVKLFERVNLQNILPKNLIGTNYIITGITHNLSKNNFITQLDLRLVE